MMDTVRMDTVRKMKLQTLRENIVQDLKVDEVFDYLLSRGVLSEDDMQRIKGERTDRDKARHLLDLLPKKNTEAFKHFVEAVRKPYPWLSQQLEAENPQSNQVEEESFLDSMLIGGLPQAPPYNVERREKLEEVRQHLHSVKRRHYVVLHGMTGCGKSCLAAAALDNKQLVIEQFKGAVYWISVGDVSSEGSGDLLSHMTDLMEKLSHHSEVESERSVQTSTSISGATDRLRRYFTTEAVREGLLILDDVSSPDVIAAFDVGCKILVTTNDSEVMRSVQGRYHLIKISEGFVEHESLSLMAKCVGVEISRLPPQAKKIHQLCKGVPMVIALIGAQLADNKDDVLRNPGRWDYYLETLARREYGNIKRFSFPQGNGMLGAIGFCIDNLHDNIKCYYQDFALFVEDVNIKPEVLATLWSRNKYEAEDIMCEFVKKSLAASKWNESLNSYVYGIHDLLLHYLRHQLSDEEKKGLHKKLLDSYKSISGGKFANLPNDNYIYFYIGHHLNEAQMWSEFPALYLDLEFVGAKLKATGPGDLLVDYKKYRRFITGDDEEFVAMLRDFEQFVQLRGLDVHKYQDLDVVQCALQEDRNSHVYKRALKIAKERPNKLYMEFL